MQNKLKSETFFYGIGKYTSVFLTLLTTSILSHLLTPAEYGVVAVTLVFTTFFSVVSDLGIGTAVIQNKELTQDDIQDIFNFSVYASILLAVLFALLGFPVSAFYGSQVYKKICALLSVSVLFTGMNIVPHGILMRQKRFKLMGMRLMCTAVCTGIAAIAMACLGFSYYALIFQNILNAAFIFFWNIKNARIRFRPGLRMTGVRKIRQYSSNQFAFSLVNYFEGNFDNLLISKILGSESLAYYDKGYRLMMYPVQNLTFVINPVLHPILSEYQNNHAFIYKSYMKVLRVLSLMGLFIASVCVWGSEEIILFFFGSQWQISVPVFRTLALSVWPHMLSSSTKAIYQSTGNTKLLFRSSLVHSSISLVIIFAGVLTGDLNTAACFVMISLYLRFFIDYYFLVAKNFKYSYTGFLRTFAKDLLIAGMLAAAAALCSPIVGTGGFLRLVVKAVIMLAVFTVGVLLTGQHRFICELIRKRS